MTRYIGLSFGGQMEIPSVERCPECDARPKYVDSEYPDGSVYPRYVCAKCSYVWSSLR